MVLKPTNRLGRKEPTLSWNQLHQLRGCVARFLTGYWIAHQTLRPGTVALLACVVGLVGSLWLREPEILMSGVPCIRRQKWISRHATNQDLDAHLRVYVQK